MNKMMHEKVLDFQSKKDNEITQMKLSHEKELLEKEKRIKVPRSRSRGKNPFKASGILS